MNILRIDRLNVRYGDSQVLWDISLHVAQGEILALIGANGAGKTTLLKTIAGLVPQSGGTILLAGDDIGEVRAERRVRLGIALVPEGRRLFAGLTVLENLRLGCFTRNDRGTIEADLERVLNYFPELRRLTKRLTGNLSGGEQQMCAIGRALMSEPRLLLIDEMSLGLAPVIAERLANVVRDVNQETGVTVVLVEQDVELALEIGSRAYILEAGVISGGGPSLEILQSPSVRQAYMGL